MDVFSLFLGIDEPAEAQDLEVFAQTGLAKLKVLGQFAGGEAHMMLEQHENLSPIFISDSLEDFVCHIDFPLFSYIAKYLNTHSPSSFFCSKKLGLHFFCQAC